MTDIFQQKINEHIQSSQSSSQRDGKIVQLFADALAIAGTRNTIQMLSQIISKGELRGNKAAQALKSLSGLPAPSDKQVIFWR